MLKPTRADLVACLTRHAKEKLNAEIQQLQDKQRALPDSIAVAESYLQDAAVSRYKRRRDVAATMRQIEAHAGKCSIAPVRRVNVIAPAGQHENAITTPVTISVSLSATLPEVRYVLQLPAKLRKKLQKQQADRNAVAQRLQQLYLQRERLKTLGQTVIEQIVRQSLVDADPAVQAWVDAVTAKLTEALKQATT